MSSSMGAHRSVDGVVANAALRGGAKVSGVLPKALANL